MVMTFTTKEQVEDEMKLEASEHASDTAMKNMTAFPSAGARVIVAIVDTALASEKDAIKTFVDGL
jgi:hypothetical protein